MIILNFFFFILLLVILILILMLYMKQIYLQNLHKKEYLQSIQDLYDVLQKRVEMVRKYRHDLGKHIHTIENMIANSTEHLVEMDEYLGELQESYRRTQVQSYCSEEIVNVVVSIHAEQCQRKHIHFQAEIEEGDYSTISQIKLVGLLYNLLDNAQEASGNRKCINRWITFRMYTEHSAIILELKNAIAVDQKQNFITQKKNASEHGIGTKIIDQIITEFHGDKIVRWNEKEHSLFQKMTLYPEGKVEKRNDS